MENEAERIIANAQKNVKDILESANAELSCFLQEAKEQGKRRGEEEGQELLRKLEALRTSMLLELKTGVLRSAVEVAREVLAEETKVNERVVLQAALRAFLTVPDARGVSLRANHEDVPYLNANKERLLEALERAKEIDVRADRAVKRGGVILQTKSGIIDAQIDTQLEEIATSLGVS